MKRILIGFFIILAFSLVLAQGLNKAEDKGNNIDISNENQNKPVQTGIYTSESGKQIQVQEQENNRIMLRANNISAQTSMQIVQEQSQNRTRLRAKLSNGKYSEIKIMPDAASEKAIEVLKLKVCSEENNCQIELKEIGSGNQTRAAYEIKAQQQTRLFGLFKARMRIQAQIDAENGEIVKVKRPWWAFLAKEA